MIPSLAPERLSKDVTRKAVTVVGVVLILAGLGVLLYFVWQYFGSNVVAKHKQAEIKHSLAQDWGKGIEGDAIGLLRVKRFGDNYEVPIVEGFGKDDLARGIGMYPDGELPGEIGNFVIAGHRVTHGEPFSKFPKLRKGDKVVVETRTHIYTYKLRNSGKSIVVDFNTEWPLWPVPDPDTGGEKPSDAVITMVTCSELFHTKNRSVVVGDLVSSISKSNSTSATTG